jgi:8-oxo-dGTP pyrophosphatase MutT (NUDIX family)
MDQHAAVLDTRTIYAGRIFTVTLDRVRLPHGPEVSLEVVRHPGSAILLPMPSASSLILVRQYRHAVGQWLWELPAGSLEAGEDAAAGAVRECEEEIGLIPGRVELVGRFYPTPGFCSEEMRFFKLTELAEPPAGAPRAEQDEDEHLEVRRFSLDEIGTMIREGEILDLKTAVGLSLLGA